MILVKFLQAGAIADDYEVCNTLQDAKDFIADMQGVVEGGVSEVFYFTVQPITDKMMESAKL